MPEEQEVFAMSYFFNKWLMSIKDRLQVESVQIRATNDNTLSECLEEKQVAFLSTSFAKGKELFIPFQDSDQNCIGGVAIHFLLHGNLKILKSISALDELIVSASNLNVRAVIKCASKHDKNYIYIALMDTDNKITPAKMTYFDSFTDFNKHVDEIAAPFWQTQEDVHKILDRFYSLCGNRKVKACLQEQLVKNKAIVSGIGKRIMILFDKHNPNLLERKTKDVPRLEMKSSIEKVRHHMNQYYSELLSRIKIQYGDSPETAIAEVYNVSKQMQY